MQKKYQFRYNESNPCKNITGLSFGKQLSLNLSEMQPLSPKYYSFNHRWQQLSTRQYIKISVDWASTIFGLVRKVPVKWFGCCYACSITTVLALSIGNTASNTVTAPFWKWVSTEHQGLLDLHLALSKCWFVLIIHIWCIGGHFKQNNAWYLRYPIMKISVHWVSMISSLISQVITKWSGSGYA